VLFGVQPIDMTEQAERLAITVAQTIPVRMDAEFKLAKQTCS